MAVLVCSLLVASDVRADAADLAPAGPRRFALGGEIGYFTADQGASNLYLLAPQLFGRYALDARWSIAADFGVVGVLQSPDAGPGEQVAVRPGNPAAFLLWQVEHAVTRCQLGLGGAAPLAVVERDASGRLQRSAYDYAQALSGLWDVWAWAPSRGAIVAYGKLEHDLHPEARFELELAPALLIPARDAFTRDSVDVFLPTAIDFSSHKGPVRFGLRLQAVLMPTAEPDALQLALEPHVRVDFGGAFAEARYTANLDEPLAGARGPRSWGLHIGGGGAL